MSVSGSMILLSLKIAVVSGMEEKCVLKRKRSIGKAILSLCLAIMLVLQTVAFSGTGYADGALSDSGAEAVIEADSPSVDEPPPVTKAVY
ncbi:hypothetical protein, partial [Clostridium perfringens]|uniref:hypothetical protein n=1 Tax=Clostridium perfringens TaxID=1502 RepID=UPI002ACC1899